MVVDRPVHLGDGVSLEVVRPSTPRAIQLGHQLCGLSPFLQPDVLDRAHGSATAALIKRFACKLTRKLVVKIVLRPILDPVGGLVQQTVDRTREFSAAFISVTVENDGPIDAIAAREQKCR